jgi:hypothetical protein
LVGAYDGCVVVTITTEWSGSWKRLGEPCAARPPPLGTDHERPDDDVSRAESLDVNRVRALSENDRGGPGNLDPREIIDLVREPERRLEDQHNAEDRGDRTDADDDEIPTTRGRISAVGPNGDGAMPNGGDATNGGTGGDAVGLGGGGGSVDT